MQLSNKYRVDFFHKWCKSTNLPRNKYQRNSIYTTLEGTKSTNPQRIELNLEILNCTHELKHSLDLNNIASIKLKSIIRNRGVIKPAALIQSLALVSILQYSLPTTTENFNGVTYEKRETK